MKACSQKEIRLLAALTALVAVSGCGVSEEELAQLEAEQTETGAVEQALGCNYCPGNMVNYRTQPGFQLLCHCTSQAAGSGAVWGTDLYTDDSTLCRAALHAGAISSSGGSVLVTMAGGSTSYTGSTRNGVTSFNYGSWPASYTVSAGSPCTPPCLPSLVSYRGQNGTVVTCNCSSSQTTSGGVWGTNIYTDDSALCRAAVHAGRITTSGGIISAIVSPGQSSYTGSTQNGVTSASYGSYSGSYSFQ